MSTNRKKTGPARTAKRYDETFKLDAVRLLQQAGRSRAQVAPDPGLSVVSLAAWEARYGTEGAGAMPWRAIQLR